MNNSFRLLFRRELRVDNSSARTVDRHGDLQRTYWLWLNLEEQDEKKWAALTKHCSLSWSLHWIYLVHSRILTRSPRIRTPISMEISLAFQMTKHKKGYKIKKSDWQSISMLGCTGVYSHTGATSRVFMIIHILTSILSELRMLAKLIKPNWVMFSITRAKNTAYV